MVRNKCKRGWGGVHCWKGCWKGVPALEGGVPALEGGGSSAGRAGVPALEGGSSGGSSRGSSAGRGFQRGFQQGFQRWKGVPAGVLAPISWSLGGPHGQGCSSVLHSLPPLTAYSQLKDRAQHERRGHIAKVLAALLVEDTPLVQETVDGLFVRSKADAEGEDSHAYRAAIRVWKYALDSNLSIRQTLRLPRHCTQRDLADTRTRLTRYTAETLTVSGGSMHQRSAAVTQLKDVAVDQVQLAIAEGNFKHNGTEKCIWVVVVPDATPLWKTSVSKADVFVHVWGEGVKAAGHIARWEMWWCMDGPDDAGCLLAIDDIGKLNEQVVALQRDTTVFIDGESWRFVVFLSGDGKLMAVTNGGGKCWCRDDVTILVPLDHVLANVR